MNLSQETIDKLGLILEKRGHKTTPEELYLIATGLVGLFGTLINFEQKYKNNQNENEPIAK